MTNEDLIVQRPATPSQLVLLFHGVGSSARDLAPLDEALAPHLPDAAIVSVQAPEASGLGWPWFSVRGVTEANRPARVAAAMPGFVQAFSVFTGFGLLATYALLGSTWLIMKTEGLLLLRMRLLARTLAWVLLLFIGAISLWTPLAHERIAERWLTWPNLGWFMPVPVLVLWAMWRLSKALKGTNDTAPFIYTLLLIFLGYSGLGISLWPHIVPPAISIYDAAGPPQSLGFALVGALLIIPLILMYTAWGYWVFRGKVRRGDGYH